MPGQNSRRLAAAVLGATLSLPMMGHASRDARAQTVNDGSDAAIGKADTGVILSLAKSYLGKDAAPKITDLRRAKGSIICGTVNVKGKDGRYLGERGFIADVSIPSFARLPDGVELLNPRAAGFEEKEKVRQQYFDLCMD